MKFQLIETKLTSEFRFQFKKCVIFLYMDEKRVPFMNFKMVNAKNLKMEFKKTAKIWQIYSLRI